MHAEPVFGKKHKMVGQVTKPAARRPVFVSSDDTSAKIESSLQSESESTMESSTSPARPKIHVPPRKRMAQPKPFPSLVNKKPEEKADMSASEQSSLDAASESATPPEQDIDPAMMEESRPRQWDLKFALGLIALVVAINLALTLILSEDDVSSKTSIEANKGNITPELTASEKPLIPPPSPARSAPSAPPMSASVAKPKPPVPAAPAVTDSAAKEAASLAPAAGGQPELPQALPTPTPQKPIVITNQAPTPPTTTFTPSAKAPAADNADLLSILSKQ